MPGHLVPWKEGSTEVDVVITWENPPTTVFIEMKYRSELSEHTSHNFGRKGFPSDQLIRNARVGLYKCGWYDEPKLFDMPPQDFVLLLVSPSPQIDLVNKYGDPTQLRRSIPHGHLLRRLPRLPFIGQLDYTAIIVILRARVRLMTRPERILVSQLCEYLRFKLAAGS